MDSSTWSRRRFGALAVMAAGALTVGVASPALAEPAVATPAGPAGASAGTSTAVTLPAPTGQYRVGATSLHLVDGGRTDPWAPQGGPRELMATVWYPATAAADAFPRVRYTTAKVGAEYDARLELPAGSVASVRPHARENAPAVSAPGGLPVLLYSPGRGNSRLTGTSVAEELASRGFVVVGVDHTYDSPTELPGGRFVPQSLPAPSPETLPGETRVRADDLRFVLDALVGDRRPPVLAGRLDPGRIGAFGHSIGGAAAAELARTDPRVRAGIDVDGSLWGEARNGLDRPFLLLTAGVDESLLSFRAGHRAWGRQLLVASAGHMSFVDPGVLASAYGLKDRWPAEKYQRAFGSIDGVRAAEVTRAYVTAFFDHHLRGGSSALLDAASSRFPEVTIDWRRD
ncbi:Alpha/beta hydrolase family protein [Streptoalloteichus tenebrarius]|uniref:Alpha/beta hydrolase family protein n=1 Tax=Streptoalloteichus tenebrarius (strain ATCC 17920 / DSM 40477 / JCM 4838 / CBS 697.72 / NBRC 16177 / NCIMB 11028 / NRRL B-12390 / A12253. 1 / ISP 5477) TaxID=1933 RepID=A0ABT1I427_STRSD|nr:hypothetical protein [Streptoalloteichus tenebrarius]MCP2262495.1 Alpha/beta hydrolase family protein [Streptoalloteichus tenebrarius]BFE99669.1 lipase [Streptoalloteichus tenebrarius]